MKKYDKQRHKANVKARRARIRLRIREYKLALGCAVCGYAKSGYALEFHHRDPETKSFELAQAGTRGFAWAVIEAEIAKCDVLCANCHAELRDTED